MVVLGGPLLPPFVLAQETSLGSPHHGRASSWTEPSTHSSDRIPSLPVPQKKWLAERPMFHLAERDSAQWRKPFLHTTPPTPAQGPPVARESSSQQPSSRRRDLPVGDVPRLTAGSAAAIRQWSVQASGRSHHAARRGPSHCQGLTTRHALLGFRRSHPRVELPRRIRLHARRHVADTPLQPFCNPNARSAIGFVGTRWEAGF